MAVSILQEGTHDQRLTPVLLKAVLMSSQYGSSPSIPHKLTREIRTESPRTSRKVFVSNSSF